MAVVLPVAFLRSKPLRFRVACSGSAWLIIVGFSVFYASLTGVITYVFVSESLFLMSVMLLCSLWLLKAQGKPGPAGGRDTVGGEQHEERGFQDHLTDHGVICWHLFHHYLHSVPLAFQGVVIHP